MNTLAIVKFLHVISAFWMVAGVAARDLVYWRAGREQDPRSIHTLLAAAGIFERWGAIRGGIAVLVFGLLTSWLGRWPLFGTYQRSGANWLLVSLAIYIAMMLLIRPLGLVRRREALEAEVHHALAEGHMTPDLAAGLKDPVVTGYRILELIGLVVVIYLMEVKPF